MQVHYIRFLASALHKKRLKTHGNDRDHDGVTQGAVLEVVGGASSVEAIEGDVRFYVKRNFGDNICISTYR